MRVFYDRLLALVLALGLLAAALSAAHAGPYEEALLQFTTDSFDDTIEGINGVASSGHPLAATVIGALQGGRLFFNAESKQLFIKDETDRLIDALPGIEAPNLTGGVSKMLPNHHITKPVFIGEVRGDGQFDVVWKTKGLVPGDAWSDFLPGSKDLVADWVTLKCGNYNKVTKKCGGA